MAQLAIKLDARLYHNSDIGRGSSRLFIPVFQHPVSNHVSIITNSQVHCIVLQ